MTGSFTYDVFLSHNSRDKAKVRALAKRLKDAGLRVWFDEWVIKPGDDIYLAIERGLEAARVQVPCLSPEALGSDWVTLENRCGPCPSLSARRTRRSDGREIFEVKNERHLEYWLNQPVDVYLVIRQTGEETGAERIRWMNVSRYLRERKDKWSRQIVFEGEPLTMEAMWRKRDEFFPTGRAAGRERVRKV